ncbi:Ketosteroid isomerase-related protein [Catalinimonas alkaloidigena]|uniref:Ketosteroid isomerase-related protein n=1 Tax=Catalinimonas alkaloidigena TaxID=1075417 RepID=A0A1G9H1P0_9BACT|nr:nuclear transport factor 2 family protein [Catalinimonas alkaloidigena]SDL06463.1 Ketosteroid isomerase-related protein [Catalinimonas alkaloidigena]
MTTNPKTLVEEINRTFEEADIEAFLRHCTDDVRWNMLGSAPWIGKDAIREAMGEMNPANAPKIYATRMIAEGDIVACEGTMEMTDTQGKFHQGAYCDVYRLQDGKVKELTSYYVETKEKAAAELTQ